MKTDRERWRFVWNVGNELVAREARIAMMHTRAGLHRLARQRMDRLSVFSALQARWLDVLRARADARVGGEK